MFSKSLLAAAFAATFANAYCGLGMHGEHKEKNYTCSEEGKKICNAEQEPCYAGQVWNEEACMCFSQSQCRISCPAGQILDPRLPCKCIDQADYDSLFTCDPEADKPKEEGEITCPFKLAEMAAEKKAKEEAAAALEAAVDIPAVPESIEAIEVKVAPEEAIKIEAPKEAIAFGGTKFDLGSFGGASGGFGFPSFSDNINDMPDAPKFGDFGGHFG